MDYKKLTFIVGYCLFFLSFAVIAVLLAGAVPVPLFLKCPVDFGTMLWNERKLDVAVQVVLIFACAMGILTFFAERKK
ncbi:MAG: hypothetical protein NTZ10_01470 [Candidatus Saganbacteria bacterium]|nr:hypothetical protein [Candidatus Saganbacteria bacterium]